MTLKFILGCLLILVMLLVMGRWYLLEWSETQIPLAEAKSVVLRQNQSLANFANNLADHGLVDSAFMFRLLVKYEGSYPDFKAGSYRFEGLISPSLLIKEIKEGRIYVEPDLVISIPEGFTLKQIASRLAARGIGDEKNNLLYFKDPKTTKLYGINAQSLEGYLYPATYFFYDGIPTLETVVSTMVKRFFKSIPESLREDLKALNLSFEDAVIFASLIEMESFFDDEKPKVAEVIWNRLKKGIPLGIDAALIYGIDEYGGDITWKHLKDTKNPYNTRIYKGLPPTAIGAPSASSFSAIVTPSHEGYYYYVLLPGNSKRHYFSKTLEEHNKQVKILIKAQKRP